MDQVEFGGVTIVADILTGTVVITILVHLFIAVCVVIRLITMRPLAHLSLALSWLFCFAFLKNVFFCEFDFLLVNFG